MLKLDISFKLSEIKKSGEKKEFFSVPGLLELTDVDGSLEKFLGNSRPEIAHGMHCLVSCIAQHINEDLDSVRLSIEHEEEKLFGANLSNFKWNA